MIDDERVEVRRYLPATRRRKTSIAILTGLAVLVCSFSLGHYVAVRNVANVSTRADFWERRAAELEAARNLLQQQAANLERGAAIDAEVFETVRSELQDSRQHIAGLEEEIALYRGLMDPQADVTGIDIHGFELFPLGESGRYEFRLVFQQIAKRHRLLKGYATLSLHGRNVDGEAEIPLYQLSDEVAEEKMTLRFRYFQIVEGILTLPQGFWPEKVRIAAKSSGRKPQETEKVLDWPIPAPNST